MDLDDNFIDVGSSQATGLTMAFQLYKGKSTGVDYTPPNIIEIGAGIYAFDNTPETLQDDIIFVAEDTSGRYRVAGEFKKIRFQKTEINASGGYDSSGRLTSGVKTVYEKNNNDQYEVKETVNITQTFAGNRISTVAEERVS